MTWLLFFYSATMTVLFVIATFANRDLAAENRLRRRNEIAANTRLAQAIGHPSASFERRTR